MRRNRGWEGRGEKRRALPLLSLPLFPLGTEKRKGRVLLSPSILSRFPPLLTLLLSPLFLPAPPPPLSHLTRFSLVCFIRFLMK